VMYEVGWWYACGMYGVQSTSMYLMRYAICNVRSMQLWGPSFHVKLKQIKGLISGKGNELGSYLILL
jgi:hypothetical protein